MSSRLIIKSGNSALKFVCCWPCVTWLNETHLLSPVFVLVYYLCNDIFVCVLNLYQLL